MRGIELKRARFRLLLETLREELEGERGGWQELAAQKLGISQTLVSKIQRGDRDPGLSTIEKARTRLRIRSAFFEDSTLTTPSYHDFVGERSPSEPAPPDPPHWAEFINQYEFLDELEDEDFETMKRFHQDGRGRRGVRIVSWYDWLRLAEWVRNRKPSIHSE